MEWANFLEGEACHAVHTCVCPAAGNTWTNSFLGHRFLVNCKSLVTGEESVMETAFLCVTCGILGDQVGCMQGKLVQKYHLCPITES